MQDIIMIIYRFKSGRRKSRGHFHHTQGNARVLEERRAASVDSQNCKSVPQNHLKTALITFHCHQFK